MKHSNFLISMVLVGGLAFAQTSSNGASTQTSGQNSQSGQPLTNHFPTSQQTLRGCLRQSGGSWTISQNGQETALIGDSSLLTPHEGEQVEVQGTQPIGGPVQVTSVFKIYRYCIGESSTPTPKPSSSSTDTQPTTKPTTSTQSQRSTSTTDQTTAPSNPPAPPAGSQSNQPSATPPMN